MKRNYRLSVVMMKMFIIYIIINDPLMPSVAIIINELLNPSVAMSHVPLGQRRFHSRGQLTFTLVFITSRVY